MKKKIVVGGSILAVIIFVLASFTSVANAQSVELSINERTSELLKSNDRSSLNLKWEIIATLINNIMKGNWYPGELIATILWVIFILIVQFWFPD